jgi:ADP-ribosylglycohydrolase
MVFSAVGDALGWPTEFLERKAGRRPPFTLPLRDFVSWQKFVGGRWWGYLDDIGRGEYSDDTQLALAVARSISSTGDFEPERFAYSELPLWLHYERGGGRSVKTAARALVRPKIDWLHNFYKQGAADYRTAGANGAAMRSLPIALVSSGNERRLVRDSFFNSVITHGHPRAILGTILFGLAVRHSLLEEQSNPEVMVQYLRERTEDLGRLIGDEQRLASWVENWEKRGKAAKGSFKSSFAEARCEAHRYLSLIHDSLRKPAEEYYQLVGALNPSTRGSGVSTVCVAIYLFLLHVDRPSEAVYAAVNQLGSDTDTIASFVGALLGARHGSDAVPRHLWDRIQDREYLLKVADRIHALVLGEPSEHAATGVRLEQQEAYLRILAWEIGLHEMFWDAIDIGDAVVHPTLGKGVIKAKNVRPIAREGCAAKLVRINFDCGQTCIFHSRVKNNEKVAESLAIAVEKALGQE